MTQVSFSKQANMKLLGLSFVLLNLMDTGLTLNGLGVGAYELNPLMGAVFQHGVGVVVLLRLVASAFVAWVLYRFRFERALKIAVIAFLVVLFTNMVNFWSTVSL